MKFLREISRKYKDKEYYKFKINIPKKILDKLNIKNGDELSVNVDHDKIILKKQVKIVE
jgi:AbrB family looped-hinge helix DNA binding protein